MKTDYNDYMNICNSIHMYDSYMNIYDNIFFFLILFLLKKSKRRRKTRGSQVKTKMQET